MSWEKWPSAADLLTSPFLAQKKTHEGQEEAQNGPSEALLRSAQAALTAASETVSSAEERRAEAAVADVLAASGAGAVAKTAIGVAGQLRRQWLHTQAKVGRKTLPRRGGCLGSPQRKATPRRRVRLVRCTT